MCHLHVHRVFTTICNCMQMLHACGVLSFYRLLERNTLQFQWRRQPSKRARSFPGQNILEPGHPDALFSAKKLTTFFSRRPHCWDCFTVKINKYSAELEREPGAGSGSSGQVIWPGAPWCSAATVPFTTDKVKSGVDISDIQMCRYEVKTVMPWTHVPV